MKKLMIAAAVVASCAMANAATITWESDAVSDLIIDGGAVDFTVEPGHLNWYLYENSTAYSMDTIWDSFKNGTLAGTIVTPGGLDGATGWYDVDPSFFAQTGLTDGEEGTPVYFASIMVYEKDGKFDDPSHYMVNTGVMEISEAGATMTDIGNTIGGATGAGGATTWQAAAVPEPTSGLLLLLGVAGLALRRRRA